MRSDREGPPLRRLPEEEDRQRRRWQPVHDPKVAPDNLQPQDGATKVRQLLPEQGEQVSIVSPKRYWKIKLDFLNLAQGPG